MDIISNENITIDLIDDNDNNDNIHLLDNEENLLDLFNKLETETNPVLEYNSINISHIINYNDNFTLKDIMTICDYYGISKLIKFHKYNKLQTIEFLVQFETNKQNYAIVTKRKRYWFYINELKKEKFFKKYILW